MAEPTSRPVADPRILRAIAHPVRNRILGELSAAGPSRAADLAADLGIPANQASFHLRQLAKYGLVEEAPELARDRRDRVWRAVHAEGVTVETSLMEEDAGGLAALRVFHRSLSAWAHSVVDAAFSTEKIPDTQRTIGDYRIKLTKAEATELSAELDAVARAWTERTRGRDSSRRTYVLLSMLQPETPLITHPDEAAAGEEG